MKGFARGFIKQLKHAFKYDHHSNRQVLDLFFLSINVASTCPWVRR